MVNVAKKFVDSQKSPRQRYAELESKKDWTPQGELRDEMIEDLYDKIELLSEVMLKLEEDLNAKQSQMQEIVSTLRRILLKNKEEFEGNAYDAVVSMNLTELGKKVGIHL